MISLYANYFKTLAAHKLDLLLSALNSLVNLLSNYFFFTAVYRFFPEVSGYKIDDMLLCFSFYLINRGVGCFFTNSLLSIEEHILRGTLDSYIIRPLPVIVQILAEKLDFPELINVAVGTMIFGHVWETYDYSYVVLLLLVSVFAGICIFFSIRLLTMSIAFWTRTSLPICIAISNLSEFAKYPISIYGNMIKAFLIYLVPYGLISYIPVLVILDRISLLRAVIITAIICLAFIFFSLKVWKLGLKKYESSGN